MYTLQSIHDEQENFISDLLMYNILFTADFDTKVIPTKEFQSGVALLHAVLLVSH